VYREKERISAAEYETAYLKDINSILRPARCFHDKSDKGRPRVGERCSMNIRDFITVSKGASHRTVMPVSH